VPTYLFMLELNVCGRSYFLIQLIISHYHQCHCMMICVTSCKKITTKTKSVLNVDRERKSFWNFYIELHIYL